MMTYAQLRDYLSKLTDDQLKSHVTIYIESNDEYFPVSEEHFFFADKENNILDENAPYIRID